MKPNKMKDVDRPITNPTNAWRVCYDLCSIGFSWFGLHSLSVTSLSFKDLNLLCEIRGGSCDSFVHEDLSY